MIERRVGHLPVLVGFELDKIEISTPLEDAIKNLVECFDAAGDVT